MNNTKKKGQKMRVKESYERKVKKEGQVRLPNKGRLRKIS